MRKIKPKINIFRCHCISITMLTIGRAELILFFLILKLWKQVVWNI